MKTQTPNEREAKELKRNQKNGQRWVKVGRYRLMDIRVKIAHLLTPQTRYQHPWQALGHKDPAWNGMVL